MNQLWKKITAGTLAIGLLLGCSGCAKTAPSDLTSLQKEPTSQSAVGSDPVSLDQLELPNLAVAAEYPVLPPEPLPGDYDSLDDYKDAYDTWLAQTYELTASPSDAHNLDPFLKDVMAQFLTGDENAACSPLNIYFALALLAETAAGNSRQQILDVLGHSGTDSLRQQVSQLWKAHYCNSEEAVSLMANSVWLDDEYSFRQEALSVLAEHYFASAFTGDLGTEEMNAQLARWLNAQTGGLLDEYTQDIQLDPETVFTLASTAYFRSNWWSTFDASNTRELPFCTEDQTILTDFMRQRYEDDTYYWGDDFSAVRLSMHEGYDMWLILPDEGHSPQSVLGSGGYYELISDPKHFTTQKTANINLSMPKFDVSSQQSLIPGLKAMGISDIFNEVGADFGSITSQEVFVSDVQHAARVAVDEEGVVAAAYTFSAVIACCAPWDEPPEVYFTLDRPFLFVITGSDNLPLFAGVIAEP